MAARWEAAVAAAETEAETAVGGVGCGQACAGVLGLRRRAKEPAPPLGPFAHALQAHSTALPVLAARAANAETAATARRPSATAALGGDDGREDREQQEDRSSGGHGLRQGVPVPYLASKPSSAWFVSLSRSRHSGVASA